MANTGIPSDNTTTGIGEGLTKAKEQVTDFASEQFSQAKSQATSFVEQRKTAMAESLSDVSQALRQSAGTLKDGGLAYEITSATSEHLERLGSHVRDSSLQDWAGAIQDFARRRPEVLFGAAMMAGLVLMRLFKTSTSYHPGGSASTGRTGESDTSRSFTHPNATGKSAAANGSHGNGAGQSYTAPSI